MPTPPPRIPPHMPLPPGGSQPPPDGFGSGITPVPYMPGFFWGPNGQLYQITDLSLGREKQDLAKAPPQDLEALTTTFIQTLTDSGVARQLTAGTKRIEISATGYRLDQGLPTSYTEAKHGARLQNIQSLSELTRRTAAAADRRPPLAKEPQQPPSPRSDDSGKLSPPPPPSPTDATVVAPTRSLPPSSLSPLPPSAPPSSLPPSAPPSPLPTPRLQPEAAAIAKEFPPPFKITGPFYLSYSCRMPPPEGTLFTGSLRLSAGDPTLSREEILQAAQAAFECLLPTELKALQDAPGPVDITLSKTEAKFTGIVSPFAVDLTIPELSGYPLPDIKLSLVRATPPEKKKGFWESLAGSTGTRVSTAVASAVNSLFSEDFQETLGIRSWVFRTLQPPLPLDRGGYDAFGQSLHVACSVAHEMALEEREKKLLEGAYTKSQQIQEALIRPASKIPYELEKLADVYFQELKTLKHGEEAMIPCGYYTDSGFQPVQLLFKRTKEDKFILEASNDDPRLGMRQIQPIQMYEMKTEQDISGCLRGMLLQLVPPAHAKASAEAAQIRRHALQQAMQWEMRGLIPEEGAEIPEELEALRAQTLAATSYTDPTYAILRQHGNKVELPLDRIRLINSSGFSPLRNVMKWIDLYAEHRKTPEEKIEEASLVASQLCDALLHNHEQLSAPLLVRGAENALAWIAELERKLAKFHGFSYPEEAQLPPELSVKRAEISTLLARARKKVAATEVAASKERLSETPGMAPRYAKVAEATTPSGVNAPAAGGASPKVKAAAPAAAPMRSWKAYQSLLQEAEALRSGDAIAAQQMHILLQHLPPGGIDYVLATSPDRLQGVRQWVLKTLIPELFPNDTQTQAIVSDLLRTPAIAWLNDTRRQRHPTVEGMLVESPPLGQQIYSKVFHAHCSGETMTPEERQRWALVRDLRLLFDPRKEGQVQEILNTLLPAERAAPSVLTQEVYDRKFLQTLQELTTACTNLRTEAVAAADPDIRRTKLEELRALVNRTLALIPLPYQWVFDGKEDFWHLEERNIDAFKAYQKPLLDKLSTIEEIFWETNLKLFTPEGIEKGTAHVAPEEIRGAWKLRAIRLASSRKCADDTKEKIEAGLSKLPPQRREELFRPYATEHPSSIDVTNAFRWSESNKALTINWDRLSEPHEFAFLALLAKECNIPPEKLSYLPLVQFSENYQEFQELASGDPLLSLSQTPQEELECAALKMQLAADVQFSKKITSVLTRTRSPLWNEGAALDPRFFQMSKIIAETYTGGPLPEPPPVPEEVKAQQRTALLTRMLLYPEAHLRPIPLAPTAPPSTPDFFSLGTLSLQETKELPQPVQDALRRAPDTAAYCIVERTTPSSPIPPAFCGVSLNERPPTDPEQAKKKYAALTTHFPALDNFVVLPSNAPDEAGRKMAGEHSAAVVASTEKLYEVLKGMPSPKSAAQRLAYLELAKVLSTSNYEVTGAETLLGTLDYMQNYFSSLEDEAVQQKILLSLFRPHALAHMLHTSPHLLPQMIEELEALKTRAHTDNKRRTAHFVHILENRLLEQVQYTLSMWEQHGVLNPYVQGGVPHFVTGSIWDMGTLNETMTRVNRREGKPPFKATIASPLKRSLQESLGNLLDATSDFSPYLRWAKDPSLTLEERQLHATYFLEQLRRDIENRRGLPVIRTFWEDILYAYLLICDPSISTGIPLMQQRSIEWMRGIMLPEFSSFSDEEQKDVIAKLSSLYLAGEPHPDRYAAAAFKRQDAEHLVFFAGNASTPDICFDLMSGSVRGKAAAAKKEQITARKISLPKKLREHPHYKKLFGERPLQVTQESAGPVARYSFISNGIKFVLQWDKTMGNRAHALEISQERNGTRLVYHNVDALYPELDPLAALLKAKGCWVKDPPGDTPETYLFAEECDSPNENMAYKVIQSPDGKITHLAPSQEPTTRAMANLAAFYDHQRPLQMVGSQNIVYLMDVHTKKADEARIAHSDLVLSRPGGKGPWMVQEKGNRLGALNEAADAQRMQEQFGAHFSRYVLPIKSDKEGALLPQEAQEQYILFPYRIEADRPRGEMAFDQNGAGKTITPIKMRLAADGTLRGSCQGFLYLAYTALVEAETSYRRAISSQHYLRALDYLKKAEKATSSTAPEDIAQFEQIAALLQTPPQETLAGKPDPYALLLRIKIDLALQRIRRSTLQQRELSESNPEAHFKRLTTTAERYSTYLDLAKETDIDSILGRLALSPQDIHELDTIFREALHSMVHAIDSKLSYIPQLPAPTELVLPLPTEAPQEMLFTLLFQARNPAKTPLEQRPASIKTEMFHMTQEKLARNFWFYWQEICEGKIELNDLKPLFRPSRAEQPAKSKEIEESNAKADAQMRAFLFLHAEAASKKPPKAYKPPSTSEPEMTNETVAALHGGWQRPFVSHDSLNRPSG